MNALRALLLSVVARNMKSSWYVAVVIALGAPYVGACSAQTVIYPTDDAFVEENDLDGVNNGATLNARTELDNNRNDIIYLRFDISEISEPIGAATLNLAWFRDKNVDHLALLYYGLNESAPGEAEWTEFDLTYENAPGLIPDDLNTIEEFEEGHSLEETQDLDEDNLSFLGRRDLLDFTDEDNIEGQTVGYADGDMVDFLMADSDGLVTFMVLRDWDNSGTQLRFASKETLDLETILGDDEGQFSPSLVIEVGSTVPGDFNNNGTLDVADINSLTLESASGDDDPAFDVNSDGAVNSKDVAFWARELANTWIGDSNLDLEFNSGDLVQVFSAGKYEQLVEAVWAEGDWNGDGRFDSGDLVEAFVGGGYEKGPRPALAAVPEPTGHGHDDDRFGHSRCVINSPERPTFFDLRQQWTVCRIG